MGLFSQEKQVEKQFHLHIQEHEIQDNGDNEAEGEGVVIVVVPYSYIQSGILNVSRWGKESLNKWLDELNLQNTINISEISYTNKEMIVTLFENSIWAFGGTLKEKYTVTPFVVNFGVNRHIGGQVGYVEKFNYFENLGTYSEVVDLNQEDLEFKYNSVFTKENLAQIPESDISFGRKIKSISDRVLVISLKLDKVELYKYKNYVETIVEGIDYLIVEIYETNQIVK